MGSSVTIAVLTTQGTNATTELGAQSGAPTDANGQQVAISARALPSPPNVTRLFVPVFCACSLRPFFPERSSPTSLRLTPSFRFAPIFTPIFAARLSIDTLFPHQENVSVINKIRENLLSVKLNDNIALMGRFQENVNKTLQL